ncbi:hypothetical protein A3C95_01985 [Candidatus Kaiserbacteria bacterium RIFCSPHIGHO2_02_FULL_56_30]|uniref:Uncharacterized protein n=1 Tax=Candidatus Kaiserbacteria bacterium RIFCSPHIGHO2_02_FULL_56_30 TaxID=1798499 RepID=A0A1F6E450_9BACT|nr:MAG: hypothetical protein A3C95_01985 [Candidatus Kaiserbacteria bacterium RIFCSPHIGHO2_02_FULL_56_30]
MGVSTLPTWSEEQIKAAVEEARTRYDLDGRTLRYLTLGMIAYQERYFGSLKDARNPVLNGSGGYGGRLSESQQKERALLFGAMGRVAKLLEPREA